MDLIDLIGDSRTDSLPPGFLRSIKIKYKQEASHVFPKDAEKQKTAGEPADRVGSSLSDKSTPSFMGWRVPTRLVTRPAAPVPKTPASVLSYQDERKKLSSRFSGMSLRSAGSLHKPVNKTEHLPRLSSVASSRKSVMEQPKPNLPKLTTEGDVLEGLEKEEAMSPQGRKVIRKILNEADKGAGRTSLSQKAISSNVMDAVDKWLVTATDKEREVALKFFSTLAGAKAEFLKDPSQRYHTHTGNNCQYCDGKRIDEALQTLARGDSIVIRGKHAYNPKREPNLGHHSYYHLAKHRLPTRVRREYQTWHHLPVYDYSDGVPNNSSMFTQPHKPIGRHFSIHPEWGLHARIKHGAF
ncbi:uncharacterized protein LOC116308131 [Actinia tenebrosa]|uniref:Uncharacterized protein LOC116308131 n=1 Tax=Actinia tenebrosa TaxID=6105 RepID=A0A6P8JCS1_ACTTE|nr:uncharacterized protein LOC116308131 [Actinia tenebrosa]